MKEKGRERHRPRMADVIQFLTHSNAMGDFLESMVYYVFWGFR